MLVCLAGGATHWGSARPWCARGGGGALEDGGDLKKIGVRGVHVPLANNVLLPNPAPRAREVETEPDALCGLASFGTSCVGPLA